MEWYKIQCRRSILEKTIQTLQENISFQDRNFLAVFIDHARASGKAHLSWPSFAVALKNDPNGNAESVQFQATFDLLLASSCPVLDRIHRYPPWCIQVQSTSSKVGEAWTTIMHQDWNIDPQTPPWDLPFVVALLACMRIRLVYQKGLCVETYEALIDGSVWIQKKYQFTRRRSNNITFLFFHWLTLTLHQEWMGSLNALKRHGLTRSIVLSGSNENHVL